MKIKKFNVVGFRSIKWVSWEPGDLNVIIGPNGSGKSNLLRSLEMIAWGARGDLFRFIQQEGGMGVIAWDNSTQVAVYLEILGYFHRLSLSKAPEKIAYDFDLVRRGTTSGYLVGREVAKYDDNNPILERGGLEHYYSRTLTGKIDKKIHAENDLSELAISKVPEISQVRELKKSLEKIAIFHDFQTHSKAPVRYPAVVRSEPFLYGNGENLVTFLHTWYAQKQFEEMIDSAMTTGFGNDYDKLVFPPDAKGQIQLAVRFHSLENERSASDLPDGMHRYLYLLAALSGIGEPSLIAIDEPETGLHPSMLPILAEHMNNAAKKCQVIVTTHSAEFLDALSEYRPTVTVANLVDGQTQLRVVNKEELDYWLTGFTLGHYYRSGELESEE